MLEPIKAHYPGHDIVVVCQHQVAELYRACPYVAEVLEFNYRKLASDTAYLEEVVQRLRSVKADISIHSVYSRDIVGDLLALASEAPRRIVRYGCTENIAVEQRNKNNALFTEVVPEIDGWENELDRNATFLNGLGIRHEKLEPRIWISAEHDSFAESVLRSHALNPAKTIALFAGAQYDVRKSDVYGKALQRLCQREGYTVIALGTAQDFEINQINLEQCGARGTNLSGQTSLLQSAAILKHCRIAVGAETGLAHIACAVGCQNVIVLGGGHFGRFMPYSPLTSVAALPLECFGCNWSCSYRHAHCTKDLSPNTLEEAIVQTLLSKSYVPRIFMQSQSSWEKRPGLPVWKSPDQFRSRCKAQFVTVEQNVSSTIGSRNSSAL